MTWLTQAVVGDRIGLMAVRRDFALGDDVNNLVLVADASAVPAVASILESIPEHVVITAVLHVPENADRGLLRARPNLRIYWATSTSTHAPNEVLRSAVEKILPVDGSRSQFWVAAEASTVASLRARVSTISGVGRHNLHAVAYWKRETTSDERDRRIMARFTQAAREGRAMNDPDLREILEIEADQEH